MPRRGWDDSWHHYPESVPLPADSGIATSKQRGAMASTWWSRRFTEVLESYGLGTRMQRGRRYAREGQVLSLAVQTAEITAQVQGSRRTPYRVAISLPAIRETQWRAIESAIAEKVGFVAHLLAGELPEELEAVFAEGSAPLFPRAWRDLHSHCSCPDWENPCKHIAAVLYVFADQLDSDPWLILAWRGRTREAILAPLVGVPTASATEADEVAPWWPFAPGTLPPLDHAQGVEPDVLELPEDPDAVLGTLEPLDASIAGTPFTDLLGPIYELLAEPGSTREERDG